MKDKPTSMDRRELLKLSGVSLGAATAGAVGMVGISAPAYAQKLGISDSKLIEVLDRGHLIVGTGSTNPPWHFEDADGNLQGMDIDMARLLAKGLFDDPDIDERHVFPPATANVFTSR